LSASLGNIIQGAVVVMWAIVGLAIFAVPAWLRRKRRLVPVAGNLFGDTDRADRLDRRWEKSLSREAFRYEWSRSSSLASKDFDKLKHVASNFIRRHRKSRD
jgi:hypothetical protein